MRQPSLIDYARAEKEAEAETESTILLKRILSTIQRIEQYQLTTIPHPRLPRFKTTSSGNGVYRAQDRRMEEEGEFQTLYSMDHHASHASPLATPPESQAGSPATPFLDIVTDLRNKFAFTDSDDEASSTRSFISARCAISLRERDSSETIQGAELEETVCVGGNLYDHDASVYSTDLLSSHMTHLVVDRTTTPSMLDLSKTYRQQTHTPDSCDTERDMPSLALGAKARIRSIAHQGWKLRQNISVRRRNAWTQTRVRMVWNMTSSRELSMMCKELTKLRVERLRVTVRTMKEAPQKFWDSMTVQKVLYYD